MEKGKEPLERETRHVKTDPANPRKTKQPPNTQKVSDKGLRTGK